MRRYTIDQLESDLAKLNGQLGNVRHRYRLTAQRKHGFTQIYTATPGQLRHRQTTAMVGAGSPRECHQYAVAYVAEVIS